MSTSKTSQSHESKSQLPGRYADFDARKEAIFRRCRFRAEDFSFCREEEKISASTKSIRIYNELSEIDKTVMFYLASAITTYFFTIALMSFLISHEGSTELSNIIDTIILKWKEIDLPIAIGLLTISLIFLRGSVFDVSLVFFATFLYFSPENFITHTPPEESNLYTYYNEYVSRNWLIWLIIGILFSFVSQVLLRGKKEINSTVKDQSVAITLRGGNYINVPMSNLNDVERMLAVSHVDLVCRGKMFRDDARPKYKLEINPPYSLIPTHIKYTACYVRYDKRSWFDLSNFFDDLNNGAIPSFMSGILGDLYRIEVVSDTGDGFVREVGRWGHLSEVDEAYRELLDKIDSERNFSCPRKAAGGPIIM